MLKHTIISIGGGNYNIYFTLRFGLVYFVKTYVFKVKSCVFFAIPSLISICCKLKFYFVVEKLVSNVGIIAFLYNTKYFDLIKSIEVVNIDNYFLASYRLIKLEKDQ